MKKLKCNTTKQADVASLKVIQTGTPIVYVTDFMFCNISFAISLKNMLFVFIYISQHFGTKVQEKGYQNLTFFPIFVRTILKQKIKMFTMFILEVQTWRNGKTNKSPLSCHCQKCTCTQLRDKTSTPRISRKASDVWYKDFVSGDVFLCAKSRTAAPKSVKRKRFVLSSSAQPYVVMYVIYW